MNNIQQLRNHLEQQKGKKIQLDSDISSLQLAIRESGRELRRYEQALEIIRAVGMKTQQQLQYHISDITSLALDAVFNDPYQLKVEFVQRRNKTECDLLFSRNDNDIDPLEASGVGVVDIASFALRVACWSMQRPHSRAVMIMDEPFKHLDETRMGEVPAMIKELSKKLGIQFIIVTHKPTLTILADKVFEVSINKKGISKVQ